MGGWHLVLETRRWDVGELVGLWQIIMAAVKEGRKEGRNERTNERLSQEEMDGLTIDRSIV